MRGEIPPNPTSPPVKDGDRAPHDEQREVARIRRAYEHYERSRGERAKRNTANPGNRLISSSYRHQVARILAASDLPSLAECRILDVGCGRGELLAFLVDLGATPGNLFGIDLLEERIEAARKANPDIRFTCGNAEHLEFEDASFHLVSVFTVFSSILDRGMARSVAREIDRVLKPGGAILWYDFRLKSFFNPHTRPMPRRSVRLLFPEFRLQLASTTLIPPLARRLGSLTPALYPLLASIPPLRSHYLGLLLKPPLPTSSSRTSGGR